MLLLLLACTPIQDLGPLGTGPDVTFETTLGAFTVTLEPERAPGTVDNFLGYVDEGFYDGADGLGATLFHRVIPDFMDQGGGFREDGVQKTTHDPIVLEANNGLLNTRGSIAMARTSDPDSATTQFFVNTVDNDFLDGPNGYAVFGEVTDGMDTLDAIAAVPTDSSDAPLDPVVITSCTRD